MERGRGVSSVSRALRRVVSTDGDDGARGRAPTARSFVPSEWVAGTGEGAVFRKGPRVGASEARAAATKEAKRRHRSEGSEETIVEVWAPGLETKTYHSVVRRRDEAYDGATSSGTTVCVGKMNHPVPVGYGAANRRWLEAASEAVRARALARLSADDATFASRFSKGAAQFVSAIRSARAEGARWAGETPDEDALLRRIVERYDADSRKDPAEWMVDDRNSARVAGGARVLLAPACAAARVDAAGLADRRMVVRYAMRAWVTDPAMGVPLERPGERGVRPGSLRVELKCMDPSLRRHKGDRAAALADVQIRPTRRGRAAPIPTPPERR